MSVEGLSHQDRSQTSWNRSTNSVIVKSEIRSGASRVQLTIRTASLLALLASATAGT